MCFCCLCFPVPLSSFFCTTLFSNVVFCIILIACFIDPSLLTAVVSPLSHYPDSLKARSSASKHTWTGWSSRTRWLCPAGNLVYNAWRWSQFSGFCLWPSTTTFHFLTSAQTSSWTKTFSSGKFCYSDFTVHNLSFVDLFYHCNNITHWWNWTLKLMSWK